MRKKYADEPYPASALGAVIMTLGNKPYIWTSAHSPAPPQEIRTNFVVCYAPIIGLYRLQSVEEGVGVHIHRIHYFPIINENPRSLFEGESMRRTIQNAASSCLGVPRSADLVGRGRVGLGASSSRVRVTRKGATKMNGERRERE